METCPTCGKPLQRGVLYCGGSGKGITWIPEKQHDRFLQTSYTRLLWLGAHQDEFEKEFDAYVLGDRSLKKWLDDRERIVGYVCRDCELLLVDLKEAARPHKRKPS